MNSEETGNYMEPTEETCLDNGWLFGIYDAGAQDEGGYSPKMVRCACRVYACEFAGRIVNDALFCRFGERAYISLEGLEHDVEIIERMLADLPRLPNTEE